MSSLRRTGFKLGGLPLLILLSVAGCRDEGPETHPVNGKLQLADSDVKVLAGHCLEAALTSDPLVRAYGQIQEDGSFALETYQAGVISPGAVAGQYRVRVVLSDDDPERRQQAAGAIDPRFLGFETSGLTISAPADELVTLALNRR